jgi:hypothetical protein
MFKIVESICVIGRNYISCALFCRCYIKINLKYMNFEIHVGEIRVVQSHSWDIGCDVAQ